MEKIKIKFIDFWNGFLPNNNYFFNLLSEYFEVELSEEPDILIYSCYGTGYLQYECIRIFYTAENVRPDFSGCDFAISFDFNKDHRHFRLPLYALYIDQFNSQSKLLATRSKEEALKIWRGKTKFCCMVVSNLKSKKRLNFFNKLSKYKRVDSGGKALNNLGSLVKDKMEFIKDYRFVISFENSSYPGYTTEKILDSFVMDSIPLYWGNPLIHIDFNANCFLNLGNYRSEGKFIQKIIEIDNDEELAIKMIMEPKFKDAEIPLDINRERLVAFFRRIILAKHFINPVGKGKMKYLHAFNLKKNHYFNRVKEQLNRNFR
ncbi:MAG: glycosyltransferase family 10 [Ferruginibacter sp.]